MGVSKLPFKTSRRTTIIIIIIIIVITDNRNSFKLETFFLITLNKAISRVEFADI